MNHDLSTCPLSQSARPVCHARLWEILFEGAQVSQAGHGGLFNFWLVPLPNQRDPSDRDSNSSLDGKCLVKVLRNIISDLSKFSISWHGGLKLLLLLLLLLVKCLCWFLRDELSPCLLRPQVRDSSVRSHSSPDTVNGIDPSFFVSILIIFGNF